MQGSSILMSGEFLGLSLATSTGTAMMDFKGPWVVAWVIFILMAIGQVLAMKIPQYIQKKKQEKQQKLVKNPTAEQQQKTMSMVNNIMLIMIIVMGFSLPVSMCIYWFITSLISLGQSFLTQKIIANSNNKKVTKK
jgi:membrane protein insertase Oxa1/YidC/SpoIIIJ